MMDEPHRNMAFLSLGSNIQPERNLLRAVHELACFGRVVNVSTVWETAPLKNADQANYLNAAILLETALSARELKESAIAGIESRLGRIRNSDRFSPRTIDIDIMLYNHDRIQLGNRRIPDAELFERPFVAIPLAELAPDYIHPETGETLAAIAARFDPETSGMLRRDDISLFDLGNNQNEAGDLRS